MMRATTAQPDRLGNGPLMIHLREAIDAARARPGLRATVRQLLAETLAEMKMEALAATDLAPEDIVAVAAVSPDPAPQPPAHGAHLPPPRNVLAIRPRPAAAARMPEAAP